MQKHNTEVEGIKYRNGLHCTARILATEGVGFLKAFISISTTPFHLNLCALVRLLNTYICLSNPIKILASLIYACRPLPSAFLTSRGELMSKFGRLEDFIKGQHHLLSEWLLKARLFLVFIHTQKSYCREEFRVVGRSP